MAVLSARGLMEQGDIYRARSIIGFEFVCRITQPTTIGGPAIPIVSGRAWITGVSLYAGLGRSVALRIPAF
jgi:proline racemase